MSDIVDYLLIEGNNIDVELTSIRTQFLTVLT